MENFVGWEKLLALPLAIIVLLAILYFIYRVMPTWKEVKLAEIRVREKEAESRTHEASVFGKLSDTLGSMSNLIERVTIDQRRDTENMQILQRVNADTSDKMLNKLDALDIIAQIGEENGKRLEKLEEKCEMFESKLSEMKQ